eukprot:CAMPEP_0172531558 /NCGR_PEP_ID=MMETSP1067-20121228/4919_1 /TAXON_ID=265564 ORGANISM="Thalassiosira punctigera, Strain Tpunct2005C2" /NCGR_SAMPLE_ID=MMETSP1067 /ASSEMBLY_ACC=CAM_ASM_000444 /LENGTH=428 /DNA_ID=CAMNT_0013315949 /DNA_START=117 /DNA_END=1400 /DNA_ORIENTATION=-
MVFINTGSRLDNPYSYPRGGKSWKAYYSARPKLLWLSLGVTLVWLGAILAVVKENPEIKQEVLRDVKREERLIQGKLRRGRSRAKEWMRKERLWLRDRLDDPGDHPPPSSSSASAREGRERRDHPWDLTQLEDLALRTGPGDTPIHVVFSTDCGPYQHWQAYQFFLSALRVRQPGRVTQIASGCTEDEGRALRDWHDEHVAPLSFRFGLHLTPEFSSVKDSEGKAAGTYEFFNKPFGLRHWMERGEGMGIDERGRPNRHDTVVALLDPDQMLTRPITGHFSSEDGDIFRGGPVGSTGDNVDSDLSRAEGAPRFAVRHGHPLAQEYGFRDLWRKYGSHVAGPESPAAEVTPTEALRSYAAGPPYLATASDMYSIAVKWCDFVPAVYAEFPELMAEMYAYSIAAAHLELPHQLVASLMVSDTSTGSGRDG